MIPIYYRNEIFYIENYKDAKEVYETCAFIGRNFHNIKGGPIQSVNHVSCREFFILSIEEVLYLLTFYPRHFSLIFPPGVIIQDCVSSTTTRDPACLSENVAYQVSKHALSPALGPLPSTLSACTPSAIPPLTSSDLPRSVQATTSSLREDHPLFADLRETVGTSFQFKAYCYLKTEFSALYRNSSSFMHHSDTSNREFQWIIKNGNNYGVHYLLYKDEPGKVHSTFGVLLLQHLHVPLNHSKILDNSMASICIQNESSLSLKQASDALNLNLISVCRIMDQVKKQLLIITEDASKTLFAYKLTRWFPNIPR